MLGRVVPLDPLSESSRLLRRERFVQLVLEIQAVRPVRIQVIQHHDDLLSLWIRFVYQAPNDVGEIH